MNRPDEDPERCLFATTRWTLVDRAVRRGEPGGSEALGELLQAYWQPLYRHARRKGKSTEDAQDLVQGFYAHLMAGSPFATVDRGRGRFRSFLLGAFTNWMINDWHRETCIKRGGGEVPLSLDWEQAETGLWLEIADERTPVREPGSCIGPRPASPGGNWPWFGRAAFFVRRGSWLP